MFITVHCFSQLSFKIFLTKMADKADWNDESTEVFIYAMIEQIYAKERRGLSFSKKGWEGIVATFNAQTGRGYDRKQLKNRFDILRKDLRTWEMLLNETSLGIDPESRAINASPKWWEEKIQENSSYRKFRKSPLKWETELKIIFKDAIAAGSRSHCPETLPIQPDDIDPEDVYRPSVDNQEGSGYSEDDSFGQQLAPSTGVTKELAGMGVASQSGGSGPVNSESSGKRKRVVRPTQRKKLKAPPASRIADAFSVIADATRDRAAVVSASEDRSIDTVITNLLRWSE